MPEMDLAHTMRSWGVYSCLEDYTSQTDPLYTSEYGKGPFVARVPILEDSRVVTSDAKSPLHGVIFFYGEPH